MPPTGHIVTGQIVQAVKRRTRRSERDSLGKTFSSSTRHESPVSHPGLFRTFVQRSASQGLELSKVVHQVAVLLLGLRGHVVQLPDVALPDAQGEDLHAALPQGRRHRPRVPTIGVAVGDQENGFGGVGAGVAQDLLSEEENMSWQNVAQRVE